MDGVSATIVIILFVVTIISSSGSNKGFEQPTTKVPDTQQYITFVDPSMPEIPNPDYFETPGLDTQGNIKNYILKYRSGDEAEAISASIMMYSKEYGVNPKLVAALMARESRFNPQSVSSSGAVGLGQLLPSTSSAMGLSDPYSIDQNTKGTARYMRYLLDRFKKYQNQVCFALGAYLEGPNSIEDKLSYTEHTQSYVRDILNTYYKI